MASPTFASTRPIIFFFIIHDRIIIRIIIRMFDEWCCCRDGIHVHCRVGVQIGSKYCRFSPTRSRTNDAEKGGGKNQSTAYLFVCSHFSTIFKKEKHKKVALYFRYNKTTQNNTKQNNTKQM